MKQPLPDESGPAKTESDAVQHDEASDISFARTATVDDPMTTGLLAEVARRSQTTEFDEETINEVLEHIDAGDTNHPHTRRRTK